MWEGIASGVSRNSGLSLSTPPSGHAERRTVKKWISLEQEINHCEITSAERAFAGSKPYHLKTAWGNTPARQGGWDFSPASTKNRLRSRDSSRHACGKTVQNPLDPAEIRLCSALLINPNRMTRIINRSAEQITGKAMCATALSCSSD